MYKVHVMKINTIKNRNTTRHIGSPGPSKVNLPPEYQQFTKKRRVLWRSIQQGEDKMWLSKTTQFYWGRGGVLKSASTVGEECSKVLVLLAHVYLRCLLL